MEQELETFRASTRRWLSGSFAGWLTLLLMPIDVSIVILLGHRRHHVGTRHRLTNQRLIINTAL